MNDLLVENSTTEDGLTLNDANDILKNEETKSFSNLDNLTDNQDDINCDHVLNNKCKNLASNEVIEPDKLLEKELLISNSNTGENLTHKKATNVDENITLDKSKLQLSTECDSKLHIDSNHTAESAHNSSETVLNNKNESHENDKSFTETSKEYQTSSSGENKMEERVTEKKITEENLTKATLPQMNNFISNIDSSLKAYLQYKNDKNKFASEQSICKEKQARYLTESEFYDEDIMCGFGSFRPRWMQAWATAKVYVFLYSIIGILHGAYYSSLIGSLSTLENRFAFKSKISGVIMVVDELIPSFFGVFIGYYAGKAHRPRMVAVGMLLSSACCFSTACPYFIYGPAQHLTPLNVKNETGPEICDVYIEKDGCGLDNRPPTLPAVLFLLLGSFLKGFGNISYYAIGLAYMDDNSKKESTPLYLAIALALRLLGPLLGYLMSFVFLKMYENPFEDPGFGTDDPRWIGAWWLGFCVQGVLLLIFSIPIALFPRRMPGQKKPDQVTSATNKETMREMFSGLFAAIKRLAKNPVFIFLAINTVLTIFGHFGHLIMLPKYMENQFRLSASDASLYSGVTSVSCIMLSTVLGGYLVWKFKPTAKMLLGGIVGSEIILVLGYLVLTIPKCQMIEMSNFGTTNEGLILNSLCNENCDCSTTSFTPFCGSDGKTTYFSPCHAGCTQQLNTTMLPHKHKICFSLTTANLYETAYRCKVQEMQQFYGTFSVIGYFVFVRYIIIIIFYHSYMVIFMENFGNCSCVADEIGMIGGQVTEGFCPDENCWNQAIAYLIILLILLTICNTFAVCHTIILLRSVHPNDKSFALGTFETFICLCGFIPAPVTYGALVDSACLVWEKSCGQTGNCWFYDMGRYNYSIHVASSVFCGLSTMCLITLYCLSSRIRNLYVDEEDEQDYVNVKLDTVSGSVTKL